MTILITGGAGYIGNILVQKLMAAKTEAKLVNKFGNIHQRTGYGLTCHILDFDKLIVYDNLMYKQVCLTDYCYREDFEFLYGDVRDHNKLLQYIKQADVIVPLAAIVGMPACNKDPLLAEAVNFEHIKFIVDNANPKTKIIYPNTNSGYGIGEDTLFCDENTPLNPISLYGETKCRAEEYILSHKAGITLRLATVFGTRPRMRLDLLVNDFVYKAVNDGYIVLFEHSFKRNYIHIHDVSLAFIHMINEYDKYVGQTFNLGLSSANIRKMELAEKIKMYVPEFVIMTYDFKKDPDQRNYIVSNEKLEATGWHPYYTLDNGIIELIKAYNVIIHNNRQHTNL